MPVPRLFLVAPENVTVAHLAACLEAACAAGDVASLLVTSAVALGLTPLVQAKGVAILINGDPRDAARTGADGAQVEADAVIEARRAVGKDRAVGAFAGASRHLAMEAAEAGADYVALSQNSLAIGGEPIVKWWAEFFEIPCVAFDPVGPDGLDILLPQNPDFIRPSDAMWESPDAARSIIAALTRRLGSK